MAQGIGEYHRKVSKPVTIRGITYASKGEASRALGVSLTCITLAERRGKLDACGLIMANNLKPVIVNGVWYASVMSAKVGSGIGLKRLRQILNSDDSRAEWANG